MDTHTNHKEGATMETIQLYKGRNCWMAAFIKDGKPNQDIIRQFNTHHLPTPFTTSAPFETVKQTVQLRNLHCNVVLS